ncbi:MAG: reverse transcriptase family protein [Candidatus Thiodiazotropha endolucinida]|nr:reverse transcriptase family protein [Candidatus Thiodiazotropha endolucinida]
MPIQRCSKDTVLNNLGNSLIELCKSNNLCILNGRCGDDKNVGNLTFRNTSVIDYTIVSAETLLYVENFCVSELDTLFSDGHTLLTTKFKFQGRQLYATENQSKAKTNKQPRWQEGKAANFSANIDTNKLHELHKHIQEACNTKNQLKTEHINAFCNQISNLFVEAADKSFSCPSQNGLKHNQSYQKKPWFGPKCLAARQNYHKAKHLHKLDPSTSTKQELQNRSKEYKHTLNSYINKHNQSTQQKLRNMKSKRPKDFWKIINATDNKTKDDEIELKTFYDFFKNLNQQDGDNDETPFERPNIDLTDDEELINSSITESEILACIKSLKNNKSSSNDNIINEYIKSTVDTFLPTYVSLFNLIFDTGLIPDSWLEGIIRPIYKNKGDPHDPSNYRPITILSCFGKLFTSVLNLRLNSFIEYYELLNENQAGFRSGYSTTDHIFSLHALIELIKLKKKKLFCSFIDFSKAFDSVWRVGLWLKLLGNGINGKMFRIIFNMYHDIKSCVKLRGEQSAFFQIFSGVRQGENLSPVLFAIFLNDLEEFLSHNQCTGVNLEQADGDVITYLQLFVLLYADDTVIFSINADSFQENLNAFYNYTKLWKLTINFEKTKIMIFGIRNVNRYEFKLGDSVLNICDEFKYLGVIFTKSRSFYTTIKHNVEQARKALHVLYRKTRNLHLSLDTQLYLFDHTILPILLYGCEIWGFQNTQLIENFHNQFLRKITKLRKSTPIYMLHAELGRQPLSITIKSRMVGYWLSLINGSNAKIAKILYKIHFSEANNGQNLKWINFIKDILISVGRIDLFFKTVIDNPKSIKAKITQTLKDLHIQNWNSRLLDSSKGRNYSLFKVNTEIENYLLSMTKRTYIPLLKFRTANHKLPIEKGRWDNVPYAERKCNLCHKSDLGDEFHYLLVCPFFYNERKMFLKKYYYTRPNILKLKALLQSTNKKTLTGLSKLVEVIMNKFNRE